ncbi:MAG: substrate-binding domain-containing protein, partial [Methanothrix sp.]|nr:substrate-binding domain-containing protein [Methanothrix sp.]
MRDLCEVASLERPACSAVFPVSAQARIIAGVDIGFLVGSRLVEDFGRTHRGISLAVHGGIGSAATLRAVADGLAAVGLVSRALRDPEKGWGLTILPYATTAIVCGVHPAVPDDDITGSDLLRIYQGIRTHWRDGRAIALLTREPGSGSIEALEQAVPGFAAAYKVSRQAGLATTLYSDQEMHRVLARTPAGLGLTDLGAMADQHLPIKPLRFEGVLPTLANLRTGSYPLLKTLAFAFVEKRLPEAAAAFLEFVQSPAGVKVLQAMGCLPAAEGDSMLVGAGRERNVA